ncbi:MAG: T9SS type A sorting domain-containing protein, partial [Saprospiraceae bacterium]
LIQFNLPMEAVFDLSFADVSGKVIKKINGQGRKGYNEIKLNDNLPAASGIYYYTLSCGNYTATKKMIIIN